MVTSIDLLKCYQNLATLFRAQAVKQFAHRFLNIPSSGRQVGELLFLLGKSKSCMKTYMDFKLDKNLSSELLNMDKTYDFVIKPLKKWPPGNHGKHIFFLEIEIFTTKIVNSKGLKKICRQLFSTMNVLNHTIFWYKKYIKIPYGWKVRYCIRFWNDSKCNH